MPKSRRQLEAIAEHLCALVVELTSHRRGGGPHWIMVGEVLGRLRDAGIDVDLEEMDAAIAICVGNHTMKAEGKPPHSISPWQKDWQIEQQPGRGGRR